jgi:hypothetical protein
LDRPGSVPLKGGLNYLLILFQVQREAKYFFEIADAGQPLSLRFLCEAFGLELSAVQQVARESIERAERRSEGFVAGRAIGRNLTSPG